MKRRRRCAFWIGAGICLILLFFSLLFVGAVDIPASQVWDIIFFNNAAKPYWSTIVFQTRLPMAVAALGAGITLSVAGLMMQTAFANPLAGPSVLGVSSGASLGVALLMLGTGTGFFNIDVTDSVVSFGGAILGGIVTVLILIAFSSMVKNSVMLLVVGIMISYLCSSLISLLNYFSPAEGIRSYLMWGLGSYTGLQLDSALSFLAISAACCICSFLTVKSLNALLAGDRYAESIGYSVKLIRSNILLLSGLLVSVPTAFCGPIGFIGLVVPHIARMLLRTSNHLTLIPASIVLGGVLSLFCALLGVLPSERFGVLPINVITPFIGVPVILYLLINRKKILYMQ